MLIHNSFFLERKEQHTDWLKEFLQSEHAKELTTYQREQLDNMLTEVIRMTHEGEELENWTGELVVDIIVNRSCKSTPMEAAFLEALPPTMSAYFYFLEEQGYCLKGKEIGYHLLAAKTKIHQSEEERKKLEAIQQVLEEAVEDGVDLTDSDAVIQYIERSIAKRKVTNKYFEQKEAGMPISEIMFNLSPEEQDLLMEDMMEQSEMPEGELDMQEAKKGLEIMKTAIKNGMSIEEAAESLPKEMVPHVLRLFQTEMQGNLSSPAYAPPIAPVVREGKKIGRNEPCPCGSGKKYKKCCLKKKG